jgi:hypothetical protein
MVFVETAVGVGIGLYFLYKMIEPLFMLQKMQQQTEPIPVQVGGVGLQILYREDVAIDGGSLVDTIPTNSEQDVVNEVAPATLESTEFWGLDQTLSLISADELTWYSVTGVADVIPREFLIADQQPMLEGKMALTNACIPVECVDQGMETTNYDKQLASEWASQLKFGELAISAYLTMLGCHPAVDVLEQGDSGLV